MLIKSVGAILLISQDAPALKEFYSKVLELPLEDEIHDETPLHYGCEIGSVHFAIHPAGGWPGVATKDSQSPIIALMTSDLAAIVERLAGYEIVVSPMDHGFASVIAFRDPDGNHVEILQVKEDA